MQRKSASEIGSNLADFIHTSLSSFFLQKNTKQTKKMGLFRTATYSDFQLVLIRVTIRTYRNKCMRSDRWRPIQKNKRFPNTVPIYCKSLYLDFEFVNTNHDNAHGLYMSCHLPSPRELRPVLIQYYFIEPTSATFSYRRQYCALCAWQYY